jgi:hypothetical protein
VHDVRLTAHPRQHRARQSRWSGTAAASRIITRFNHRGQLHPVESTLRAQLLPRDRLDGRHREHDL